MDNVYRNYYRNHYLKTGGFVPTKPLSQNVYPGDFFQIKNGEMILLGNIYRNRLISPEDTVFDYGIKLNDANWDFKDGVRKPFSRRGTGDNRIEGEFEYSKQVFEFEREGSFYFKGNNPEAIKVLNWYDIQMELIIKLTTTQYSFREVYVVTECATVSDWTLAISSSERGQLELASDSENSGLLELFGHGSSQTIQLNEMEYFNREASRKPCFFKGKKLVVQNEKLEVFISELIGQRERLPEWAHDFYDYEFHNEPSYSPEVTRNAQASVLDMLQANELNPNTALMYFRWADINLDDIEKLFLDYGA